MIRRLPAVALFAFVAVSLAPGQNASNSPVIPIPDMKKFEPFETVVAGAKTYDGLFKLHQKGEHLYAEIAPNQLDRPYLAPIALARGAGMGGHTLNNDEQWVLVFRRSGEKVFLVRRNVRYQAKRDAPVERAVETSYTDSILLSLPIISINPARQSVVIDLADIFLTNFADLNYGRLDRSRTTWHKIKVFPRNIELQVAATFSGHGGESVIDPRGNTVVIDYGLVELPDSRYQPRLADDRVGHFVSALKDFTTDNRDTAYVRYINRWRLERVDGSPWKEGAKLVPPKKKIIFWIERSVPDEYRAAVREGILEWNKAFEKIGFRDAIEVRQQENEDFDPEDVNFNTFRWITSELGYAMGPSRANPFTGEIIDADIIFDASMIRYYKGYQQMYKNERGLLDEPASLVEASRRGWGIPVEPLQKNELSWNSRSLAKEDADKLARVAAIRQGLCQCAAQAHGEISLAMMAMSERFDQKPGDKLPDDLIQQVIKETVMHEVGHTLGLRHNFKASTMLKNDQLHNTEITRKQGLAASVMDYNPVNLAPKGVKQGDFFSTTIGPYDYWAIEYAYKPLSGSTEDEVKDLKKIASRCTEAGLDYSTDEDLMAANDPLVNMWDLGNDPMKFAKDRMELAEELMKGLAERVVEPGEGYQRARQAFTVLMRQYGDAASLTAHFVGGEYLHRDHKGDPKARDPLSPVTGAKQREALAFLQTHILTDLPFNFPPELLRKLAADRWLHWGTEFDAMRGVDFPVHERIGNIQRIVLDNLLDADTLRRVQNGTLKAETGDAPLTLAEIFRALSDSIWSDLPDRDKSGAGKTSIIHRNLQREYLKRLSNIVLRSSAPADARSLARMHLRDAGKRIDQALADKKLAMDDTLRAHLEESKEQIAKVLAANLQAGQP
jgi:Met-zincin/Domain of unknown function (DUF5117)/Domain of unknown function (DUF5118)